jgi:hypothetical protein
MHSPAHLSWTRLARGTDILFRVDLSPFTKKYGNLSHIPQFENALLDIQYCSFYLFYRLVDTPRSTGKRTYDLFLVPLFDIHGNWAIICIE